MRKKHGSQDQRANNRSRVLNLRSGSQIHKIFQENLTQKISGRKKRKEFQEIFQENDRFKGGKKGRKTLNLPTFRTLSFQVFRIKEIKENIPANKPGNCKIGNEKERETRRRERTGERGLTPKPPSSS